MLSTALPISLLLFVTTPADAGAAPELARHFGFGPMQVYKIKPSISELCLADLNGDGRTDIALWNLWQNRIELFYQPADGAAATRPALEQNEIPDRGPLVREFVSVAHRIAAMQIGEFTGDDRPDIVYFGEPRELVILPGLAAGGFDQPIAMRAPLGEPKGGGLTVGDFNGDGRQDVALRAEKQILVFYQEPEGGLRRPRRIVHDVGQVLLLMAGDLNGDGRDDLLMNVDDEEYGMCVFLQDVSGAIGAMQRIRMPKVRSVTIADGGDGADELFCIESATNRMRVLRWAEVSAGEGDWPMALYSYPMGAKGKKRPVAVGDVTGDGLVDVVAVSGETAQLVLFKGGATGLEPPVAFPALVKTNDVAIGDIDGNGTNEVISISREERMIGISRFEAGRLTFPAVFETEGIPLSVTVGTLKPGDSRVCVAYLAKHEAGENDAGGSKPTYAFHFVEAGSEQPIAKWTIAAPDDDPAGLRLVDVDQDGLNDLLLFVPYEPLAAFLQQADGSFVALDGKQARLGLVKQAAIEDAAFVDVDGDGRAELLLAQKNLARALRVEEGAWTIVDQVNPESSDAELRGLAAMPSADGLTLVLFDRNAKSLIVMRRAEDGTFAVARSIPVGDFDITAMGPIVIGADGESALLMADADKLAILRPSQGPPALVELGAYASEIKDAWLADSVVGDLNHDGVRDVLVVDMRKANLELLTQRAEHLEKVMHFQVFQGKRFSDEPGHGGQPREVLFGDVTGDGGDDVVLICHDRVIVYPGQ
jgi:hypothetical protein